MLKKAERKDALRNIYMILRQSNCNYAIEAKEKVLNMLAEDGLFIFESNAESEKARGEHEH